MQDERIDLGMSAAVPTIQIANEVIGAIAGMAATQVEGVAALSGGLVSGLSDMLGRKGMSRGVRVEVEGRRVELALHLIVAYGARIPEIAQKVQEQVKAQVERMTGLTVREVDIHIQGVSFDPVHEHAAEETPDDR